MGTLPRPRGCHLGRFPQLFPTTHKVDANARLQLEKAGVATRRFVYSTRLIPL